MAPKAGFPDAWGSKRVSVFPVTGPSSYAQYTAPSTGGQDVNLLPQAGIKIADFAVGGVSRSGLYRAEVVQIEAGPVNGQTVAGARLVLKWYVVATGSQVAGAVDLDAEIVDIFVIGPK